MKNTIDELKKAKAVAVIRTSSAARALKAIDACIEGGFKFIEITFTIPNIEDVLTTAVKKYRDHHDIFIGAGTVLTLEQAKICIELQLDYVVAPNYNPEVFFECQKNNILYIPGVMTVNEITDAMKQGIQLIKLFPANAYEPSIIKAFKAPLPNIEIMPTGGINLENITTWLAGGAIACGIGGNLVAPIEKDDYDGVVNVAKQYIAKVS